MARAQFAFCTFRLSRNELIFDISNQTCLLSCQYKKNYAAQWDTFEAIKKRFPSLVVIANHPRKITRLRVKQ